MSPRASSLCLMWLQRPESTSSQVRSQVREGKSGMFCVLNQLKHTFFDRYAGGRGVVVGPILSQSKSDVFCDNENGPNFLFKNNGDGTFVNMATQAGEYQTVRGIVRNSVSVGIEV